LIPPMSLTGKADGSKAASSDKHEPVLVQVFLELLPLPPESPRAHYLKWALLFLIGHGANVNVTIDGEEWEDDDVLLTPLKLALRLCDMEIVNAIIQAGGNVNLGDPLVDVVLALTLMEEAPSNDNPFYVFLMKAIDVLVESGANVNVGEPSIFTRAWTSWKFGLAEELANKGAKVTSEDPVPHMLRVILEQGVSMTEKENAAGLKKLVLFCISRGADTGTHDEHSGKSGMRLALECLDKDIMKAMLKASTQPLAEEGLFQLLILSLCQAKEGYDAAQEQLVITKHQDMIKFYTGILTQSVLAGADLSLGTPPAEVPELDENGDGWGPSLYKSYMGIPGTELLEGEK
jgi:hypothetical protein